MSLTGHRVVPLKIERADLGGDAGDENPMGDFPTPAEPGEDLLVCRGVAVQPASTPNNAAATSDYGMTTDASGNLTLCDPTTGTKTLAELAASGSGVTEATHKTLDHLQHLIAEDGFEEYTYSGGKVTAIIVWTDNGKTDKIRSQDFTYTGAKINTIVTKQYEADGSTVLVGNTMTETFNYSGNQIASVDRVMS